MEGKNHMKLTMLIISLVLLIGCTPTEVQISEMVAEEGIKVVEDIVQAEESKAPAAITLPAPAVQK